MCFIMLEGERTMEKYPFLHICLSKMMYNAMTID